MLTIDADMAAQGTLVVLGTVRLEGRFDGAIVCSRLEVGTDGYLLGNATTQDLVLAGQIVGTVRTSSAHLMGRALLEGELHHETLRMDEAAALVGESRRQRGFAMPPEFIAMQVRARQSDEDLRALEIENRVRRADEAAAAQAMFQQLRARFPMRASVRSAAV